MNLINQQIHHLTTQGIGEIRDLVKEKGTYLIDEDKNWIALYVDRDGDATYSNFRTIELEPNGKISVQLDDGIWLYEEELKTDHILDLLTIIEENYGTHQK